MKPVLSVFIPSYDLRLLGLPEEICDSIKEFAVASSIVDVRSIVSNSYANCIVYHNPPPHDTKMICDKNRRYLTLWYDSLMSPVYGIGTHFKTLLEQNEDCPYDEMVEAIKFRMGAHIDIVTEVTSYRHSGLDFGSISIAVAIGSLWVSHELLRQSEEDVDKLTNELVKAHGETSERLDRIERGRVIVDRTSSLGRFFSMLGVGYNFV